MLLYLFFTSNIILISFYDFVTQQQNINITRIPIITAMTPLYNNGILFVKFLQLPVQQLGTQSEQNPEFPHRSPIKGVYVAELF